MRQYGTETVLCVANLSRGTQPVELDLSNFKGRVPVEMLAGTAFPPVGELPYFVTLSPYGFFWFLLREEAEAPAWLESLRGNRRELVTLVLAQGVPSLLENEPKRTFERGVLPEFLPQQRWFAGRGQRLESARVVDLAELEGADRRWALTILEGSTAEMSNHYFVPLTLVFGPEAEDPASAMQAQVLARVRKGPRIGLLLDAAHDDRFASALVSAITAGGSIATKGGGTVRFTGSQQLRSQDLPVDAKAQRVGREQTNTTFLVGDSMVLKMLRRIESGTHPELDANRFLTEVGFKNTPAFLGSIELMQPGGGVWGLALLQARVQNQGDGWTWTVDHLRRVLDEAQLTGSASTIVVDPHGIYGALIATLGQRIAELHRAFATPAQNPAFTPEPITPSDLQRWVEDVRQQGRAAHAALEKCREAIPTGVNAAAERLLTDWDEIDQQIASFINVRSEFMKTRIHGDLHLSQVLLCKDDFSIIDFEGDPVRPLADRSAKSCILKDVADMLGSFDSAAAAALSERLDLQPQHRNDMERAAEDWRQLAYARFLEAYRSNVDGLISYPPRDVADRLLDLFLLSRVLYNIAAEASSWPGWIHVHLSALLRLLGRNA